MTLNVPWIRQCVHYSYSVRDTGYVASTFREKAELDQLFLRKVTATSPMSHAE